MMRQAIVEPTILDNFAYAADFIQRFEQQIPKLSGDRPGDIDREIMPAAREHLADALICVASKPECRFE